jgi:hypothetical protein
MDKTKVLRYILLAAIVLVTIGVLGEYDLVVIKGVSKYNFEFVLVGFLLLALTKMFKK